MKTRMEKYYDSDNSNISLRQKKNEELYDNITDYKVDDYKIETNVTVLDNDAKNINVDHIKKILDTKYNKTPKRRSIIIDTDEEEPNINLDETREYDINAILQRARSEKEVDYEKERLKKLRDTQFDILKKLDLEEDQEEKIEEKPILKENHSELLDLINTITSNELGKKIKEEEPTLDPLDILTDLKGEENTIIVGGIHNDEDSSETSPIMTLEEADKIKPKILENKENDFANTIEFTQSDFDDFNDLKKEVRSSKAMIYAIVGIVIIILLGITFFALKHFSII